MEQPRDDLSKPCRETAARILAELAKLHDERREVTLSMVLDLALTRGFFEELERRTSA